MASDVRRVARGSDVSACATTRQSVAPSLAAKAVGYGMPGVLVDGNDFAALTVVLGEAVARARAGGGPTLVEADTYRMDAHTNADDAARYRTDDEVAAWVKRDPDIPFDPWGIEPDLVVPDLRALAARL